jgi:serine/threonine-protein kinase
VYAAGYVWAVNDTVDALAQIDPRTNTVVRTVSVGSGPSGVAFGYGSLWVASNDGTVTRIDPRSGQVVGTIRVGGSPQDVATGYGRVWVTVA